MTWPATLPGSHHQLDLFHFNTRLVASLIPRPLLPGTFLALLLPIPSPHPPSPTPMPNLSSSRHAPPSAENSHHRQQLEQLRPPPTSSSSFALNGAAPPFSPTVASNNMPPPKPSATAGAESKPGHMPVEYLAATLRSTSLAADGDAIATAAAAAAAGAVDGSSSEGPLCAEAKKVVEMMVNCSSSNLTVMMTQLRKKEAQALEAIESAKTRLTEDKRLRDICAMELKVAGAQRTKHQVTVADLERKMAEITAQLKRVEASVRDDDVLEGNLKASLDSAEATVKKGQEDVDKVTYGMSQLRLMIERGKAEVLDRKRQALSQANTDAGANGKQPEAVQKPEAVKKPEAVYKPEAVKKPEAMYKPEAVKKPEDVAEAKRKEEVAVALESEYRELEAVGTKHAQGADDESANDKRTKLLDAIKEAQAYVGAATARMADGPWNDVFDELANDEVRRVRLERFPPSCSMKQVLGMITGGAVEALEREPGTSQAEVVFSSAAGCRRFVNAVRARGGKAPIHGWDDNGAMADHEAVVKVAGVGEKGSMLLERLRRIGGTRVVRLSLGAGKSPVTPAELRAEAAANGRQVAEVRTSKTAAGEKTALVMFTNVYDAVRFRVNVPTEWGATVAVVADPCGEIE